MIADVVYALLLLFAATLGELLLDSIGLSLPLIGLLCFYLAIAQGRWTGLGAAVLGGAALDFLLAREQPVSVLLFIFIVVLAELWLRKMENPEAAVLLCIPGALIPLIAWLPWAIPAWDPAKPWFDSLVDSLVSALVASICSAVLLPVVVLALDYFGSRLELSLFSTAKERLAGAK